MAKKKITRNMNEGVDARHDIAMTYDAFDRYKAGHLQSEYEDKLNNVEGPFEAVKLSHEYRRKAREHFDSGHDGARS